jgi:DDE family transposase
MVDHGPRRWCERKAKKANAERLMSGRPEHRITAADVMAILRRHVAGCPLISVDTKKKELVGEYKNGGREWHPHGQPTQVDVDDFIDDERGKAIPYGVYDLTANTGWVGVGTDHDTAAFAVATIARWWDAVGRAAYPGATKLLITADGGESNG